MDSEQIKRVILLANYSNDRQESMQRFAELFASELPKRNIAVEVIRPEVRMGKLKRSGHGLGKWLGYVDKFLLFPRELRRRMARWQPGEVLHICDHSNAVYTREGSQVPHLVTCHDLLAVRSARGEIPENRTGASGRAYQNLILNGLSGARYVTCVSGQTRDDLLRLTKLRAEQVSVTYNGLNYPYAPMPREAAMARVAKIVPPERAGRNFILHVGGNQWYKNRSGVVRIYHEANKRDPGMPDLCLVGKKWPESLRNEIAALGLAGRIMEITDCSNEDLRALYSAADLFLFPSLMEGFGWPIIEAQACGTRVVTSNVAPMTEIGGEAALYVDPRNHEQAGRAVADALGEGAAALRVRVEAGFRNAARFSTESMMDGYVAEYARALNIASGN
jgi:glycosyltransferase involved in cell wall biosynthesis